MILEIRFLGIRVVIDPKTVEALLEFTAVMVGCRYRSEKSASSANKILE
jgi:hypothetical protein